MNPYYIQAISIRDEVGKLLPYGLDTTSERLLEFMSKSDDEQMRDMAAYMRASKKSAEIKFLFDFAISLLQHDVVPIRESIYDTGLDGVKEMKDYLTDKYDTDDNVKASVKAFNFLNWLTLKLPAKEEMKRIGLIY